MKTIAIAEAYAVMPSVDVASGLFCALRAGLKLVAVVLAVGPFLALCLFGGD
ncbi:MAG: hypothetical protein JWN34_5663 [Bryobacterales bacterium]|jgi:hypothetical protein|nr:hypothetical protein [Bryobacterales bacterium]